MNRILFITLGAALSAGLMACDFDNTDGRADERDDQLEDRGLPAAPQLGAQIDRVGRPAITTALVQTFNADDAAAGDVKDAYNAASADEWAQFSEGIATNLAIYDGLDGVCGNQLLAGEDEVSGRYDALAGVLAEDRLYVNTASASCNQYLAVEANAVGIENDDCGGRTLTMDVIDVSYSVLAAGALEGVTDGIDSDYDGADHSNDDFPFVGAL